MISVIIPSHNCGETIASCLISIFNQLPHDSEVIVVDDGSTDNTPSVLNQFSEFQCLRIFKNKTRRGASHSRNLGISKALCDWILFVDADDEIPIDGISVLIIHASKKQSDVIVGSHYKSKNRDRESLHRHGLDKSVTFASDELGSYISNYSFEPYQYTLLVHCWGKLYRREIITQNSLAFDEQLEQLEDVNFNFQYLTACSWVSYVDAPCYRHVIGQTTSMSTQSGSEPDTILKIYRAYKPIRIFLEGKCGFSPVSAESTVKRLLFTTSIIWLIRINKKSIGKRLSEVARLIRPIVNSQLVKDSRSAYKLMPRDSKIIYFALIVGSPIIIALALRINELVNTRVNK
jgi:glycosyltransferase involved in cell wall biosynthesis